MRLRSLHRANPRAKGLAVDWGDCRVTISLATWNINSVRLRMPIVTRFLEENNPDVLCLQETKCRDSEFPFGDLRKAGYEHIAINGQKGYHGVAIVSKLPFAAIDKREFCQKGDARHLGVTFAPGVADADALTIHNFYVPAGGDEPDPEINDKFAHKLAFIDEMAAWFKKDRPGKERAVLVGDLNVAPLEHDVWSHKALLGVVSHTAVEVEKFTKARHAGDWHDALRHFTPDGEKLYTWWSYRSSDWAAANKGRRLDHVWLSASLAPRLAGMTVFKDVRGWDRPSDHVPVMVRLA